MKWNETKRNEMITYTQKERKLWEEEDNQTQNLRLGHMYFYIVINDPNLFESPWSIHLLSLPTDEVKNSSQKDEDVEGCILRGNMHDSKIDKILLHWLSIRINS